MSSKRWRPVTAERQLARARQLLAADQRNIVKLLLELNNVDVAD